MKRKRGCFGDHGIVTEESSDESDEPLPLQSSEQSQGSFDLVARMRRALTRDDTDFTPTPLRCHAQADQQGHTPHHDSRRANPEIPVPLASVMKRGQRKGSSEGSVKPRRQESAEADQGHEPAECETGNNQYEGEIKHGSPRSCKIPYAHHWPIARAPARILRVFRRTA